jgi:glycosyltransferase involved in cell wall biosynthesis
MSERRPLKIGYLCSDVDIPLLGHEGCSVKIREFTDALIEMGHDVFVMCNWLGEGKGVTLKARAYHVEPRGLDAAAWKLLEEEQKVVEHELERDLKSLHFNHWMQTEGAAIIEREKPDLLYEVYSLFGYAGVALRRRYDIPLVLEVNAPLVQEQAGYSKFPFTRTADALEPEIFRGADVVIGVSDWVRRFVIERGAEPSRVFAFPNGVGEHFCGELDGEAVRQRHGLVGKRVVGFVGSFHWWHDVEGLLAAHAQLAKTDPDLRLLLVGHGPERKQAEGVAERLGVTSSVVFTGNVSHDQVPQYVAAMDVAAAPFRSQLGNELYGSPMKLFEYMAAGAASITTDIGQIRDIIRHGENGWLCPPDDHGKLAEGIAALLYTPGLAKRIGATAREEILTTLTWPAVIDKILKLVETTPPLRSQGVV